MSGKELKHMGRTELLELLSKCMNEKQELQNELAKAHDEIAELTKQLENRRLEVSNAGSIAEAALLAIETLQYFTGRSADIDDVLLNLLGGMLGYGLFALLRVRLSDRPWFCAALDLHAEPDPPQADPLPDQMPEAL